MSAPPVRRLVLAMLALALPMVSAASEPVTIGYGLDEALSDGLATHPSVAISAALAEAARHRALAAESVWWPRLTGTFAQGYEAAERIPEGPAQRRFRTTNELSWKVVDGPGWADLTGARAALAARGFRHDETRRILAFSIAGAFIELHRWRSSRTAAQAVERLAEQELAETRLRVANGTVANTEIPRVELTLAQARQRVAEEDEGLAVAAVTLAAATGRPVADQLAAVPALPLPSGDLTGLLPRLAQRPDVLAASQDVQQAEADLTSQRRQAWPLVRVVGSSHDDRIWNGQGGSQEHGNQWSIALQAEVVMFDGFRRSEESEARAAEVRLRMAERRQLEHDAGLALATAQARCSARQAVLASAAARLRLAQANAHAVAARRQAGLATALESADALSGVLDAEVELATATARQQSANLDFREEIGWWPLSELPMVDPATKPP
jgi:outer membrane protein TolC